MSESIENRARVLIADDEPQIREILLELLSGDYECHEVSSAEEALALLHTEVFQLVLSDIQMSGMSGLEMVPKVLELMPETVVVMISGEQTAESAIQALRVGAFDYITKPFDLQHVEAAVRRALEHHALLKAKRRYENHLEELVEERTAELARANAVLKEQIAKLERAEERINYLAHYDALTELPNQTLFLAYLSRELSLAEHRRQKLSFIFIALDRFKKFNDTLGHEMGDCLLRSFAERLFESVRGRARVARFGGDEFALLLTDVRDAEEVTLTTKRVQEMLKTPFHLDGHELYVTVSIGISLYPEDGQDIQFLLKNAGAALHRARQQGGNNYQFYTPDMNEKALQRLSLESKLQRALERDEFRVYYQSQVKTDTGRIVGMEALVRWQHPELGLISPSEFIPLAEDTGLIVPIGEWVLRTACEQASKWRRRGVAAFNICVNLSPRQFEQPDLLEVIAGMLRETGLEADCLELELTESLLMKKPESAISTLLGLRKIGVKTAIDDFGLGYSSLNYLKHLPIDVLKIDKSFVREMTTDPKDAAIVMTIISLAHSLEMEVIAEGVETEEQLRFLRLLRCDKVQGYLLNRPSPADEFEHLLFEEQPANVLEYASALAPVKRI